MSDTLLVDTSVSFTTTQQPSQSTLATSGYFKSLQSGTSYTQQRDHAVETSTIEVGPVNTVSTSTDDSGVSIVSLGGSTSAISNSSNSSGPDVNTTTGSTENTATTTPKSNWLITLTVLTSLLVSTL
ncbi:BA75_03278T0 [Komagataella pastoris]|uniref:BA75_03278T0 n=1 Tax=Komagataella pastoris TaxID=4922 RepID=A0A1B2JDS2_PICPA|nr:BA75_03278T0 [Komagataella pastoris]